MLFTAENVVAILEDRKLQTRRLPKKQPAMADGSKAVWSRVEKVGPWFHIMADRPQSAMFTVKCPYGVPGDLIWVKETWRAGVEYDKDPPRDILDYADIAYTADNTMSIMLEKREMRGENLDVGGKIRPSIFMPRWASRLTLRITDVRVERLQDITPADAKAEGDKERSGMPEFYERGPLCHVDWYAGLWDKINSQRAPWKSNPWIFAITFERVK